METAVASDASESNVPLLVLASASPRRLSLLEQIGLVPDRLEPAYVDESPQRLELPRNLALRLAKMKAVTAQRRLAVEDNYRGALVLAADTVVAVGRRILPKAETKAQAQRCLELLSGRAHRVYTGVAVVDQKERVHSKIVETRVRFKRLSRAEIAAYLTTMEWDGKAGGYAIQGNAGAFVVQVVGSYSAVVGLPLFETSQLLAGRGLHVTQTWVDTSGSGPTVPAMLAVADI
ncbi:MAG: septum formation protein Maf [Devosiaceae bacterium]|nr:septum formation protein Maf [Devosiaceae bacterium MH13]